MNEEWFDQNYEWPGWPLKDDPHGIDFDLDARKRMVGGSELLLPFIYKYRNGVCNAILEIGPFFNPLITTKNFPNKNICYWENDRHVLKWLPKFNNSELVKPIYCDLKEIEGDSLITLQQETFKYFKEVKNTSNKFDFVIISQVLNYVDYKLFLLILKSFVKKDGLIFINNVVEHGLPDYFSDKRPKSIKETIEILEHIGYEILEKDIIATQYPDSQKKDRVILVVKNK
ncbi:MAG: hypothetical protein PF569_07580 [Candidatus Woesearchaeota archaeon]|jgi:hypothetical protein|nr:hypothetical protein [Candidatus Woesearchaeota archaeon]